MCFFAGTRKKRPRSSKRRPPGGQNDPQERPKTRQERPKRPQDGPRRRKERARSAPRAGQEAQKRSKKGHCFRVRSRWPPGGHFGVIFGPSGGSFSSLREVILGRFRPHSRGYALLAFPLLLALRARAGRKARGGNRRKTHETLPAPTARRGRAAGEQGHKRSCWLAVSMLSKRSHQRNVGKSQAVRGDRAGKPGEKTQANARNAPSSTRPALVIGGRW